MITGTGAGQQTIAPCLVTFGTGTGAGQSITAALFLLGKINIKKIKKVLIKGLTLWLYKYILVLTKGRDERKETKMKKTIATATKGYKTKELKTWEQVSEYQRRGWNIAMAAPKKAEEK